MVFGFSMKAMYPIKLHGFNGAVETFLPALCATKRLRKPEVYPV